MLDEVIEYLKQLQAQVEMMSRMSTMMMPMTMPQLQMSMMAQMAPMAQMGIGRGMGMMDLHSLNRSGYAGFPPLLHPSAFLPLPTASWDAPGDRMQQHGGTVLPDPFSAFLAYQTAQVFIKGSMH
ncbi:putative Transcription factor UNE10 [Cocos nucifera]|uniref:Putative Transcription factor UNE10 n=1 Tax=Cocos nucifera TaxID=13894 RepID=A0A8K0N8R3_COCNU|nr:putative Transcription factor UNE10 [Cocos nucifera]